MSNGQGSITFSEPPGAGGGGGSGTVNAANNGLSLSSSTTVVLGQDVGAVGDPAALLSERVIPLAGYGIKFEEPGLDTGYLSIDTNGTIALLNMYKGTTGLQLLEITTIQGAAPGVNPYGNFFWTLDESFMNADGQIDAVWQWGYNQDGTGGVVVDNEAAFWFSLESAFENIPSDQFEHEWQSIAKNGNNTRHLQLDVNKEDGNAIFIWQGSSWSINNDITAGGGPYFDVVGPNGVMTLTGSAVSFTMQPTIAGWGSVSIETNNDGSVNISNEGGGANPVFAFSNPLLSTISDPAYANLNLTIQNVGDAKAIAITGTIDTGDGVAYGIFSQVDASVAYGLQIECTGTGDAFIVVRAADGGGNSEVQWGNATNTDVFTAGLLQSAGNWVLTNGTGVGSGARMITMTPTAQAGFGGETTPTAFVHIAASGGTPGLGPLKLTAAALLAVPEDGLIEYDGTNFYKTIGAVRSIIV
jgi:hypothetical protein